MQDYIVEALDSLDMATTSEKYVLTQITSAIKQLAETSTIPTITTTLFRSVVIVGTEDIQ